MKQLALAAAVLLLASCQHAANENPQYSGKEMADTTGYAGAVTADTIAAAAPGSKLVKTAALQLQVASVHEGSRALTELAKSLGGALRRQHVAANETGRRELKRGADSLLVLHALAPSAALTVRVPSDRLDEFLFEAARVASFVQSSDLDVDDRTLDFVSAQWRAENRARFLASSRTSPKVTGSTQGLVIRDEEAGQRLDQRAIDDVVRYSTVRIELAGAPLLRREVIADTNLDSYSPGFGSRLGDALKNGWGLFENLLVAGANLWVFLLAALLAWAGWRKWGIAKTRVQTVK
ncbi:DUF4349 domain-containing protein [Flaviaesturariibacter terrae]